MRPAIDGAELLTCSGTLLPRLRIAWTGDVGDRDRVALAWGISDDPLQVGDPSALVETTEPAVSATARGAPQPALALAARTVAARAAGEGLQLSAPRVLVVDRAAGTLMLYAGLRLRRAPCEWRRRS